MGLDNVELLVAIEEIFQITVSDAEAERIATAGDLHALILTKLPGERSNPCLTSTAFFQLRLAIMQVFGLRRSQVRPSTLLAPLMPFRRRRAQWRKLQQASGLRLPALEAQLGLHLALIVAAISAAALPMFMGVLPADPLALGIFLLVVSLVVYLVLLRITPVLRLAFPVRPATVGALARQVVSLNHSTIALEKNARREVEVWATLRSVIAQQIQIDPANIEPNSRLTRDLGID